MQLTLSSPEITCDHCIAMIKQAVDGVEGARFLEGAWQTRQFAVELASGAVLDAVTAALEAEGYPLGDAPVTSAAASTAPAVDESSWTPAYRVTATHAGADVNYACPCSCDAGFAFDRSRANPDPEHCCCGRTMLVGRDAEARLRATLPDVEAYRLDRQSVTMPWGQPLEAVLAIPLAGAEHGAH